MAPYADREILLVTVTSDAAQGALPMKAVVDADSVLKEITFTTTDGTTSRYTLEQIRAGVVIMRSGGRDVVKLKAEKFDALDGGEVVINYLHNGLDGTRRNYPIDLRRTGTDWGTSVNETTGRRAFTRMHMKAKRILGTIVGIDKITVQ